MSYVNHNIRLFPPDYNGTSETFRVPGFKCTRCNGLGYISVDVNPRESEQKTCPHCNGSRTLCAHIHIKWKPGTP
jgi:excinuclease UvrABC ATPase subunit